jgi:hypothetical protein
MLERNSIKCLLLPVENRSTDWALRRRVLYGSEFCRKYHKNGYMRVLWKYDSCSMSQIHIGSGCRRSKFTFTTKVLFKERPRGTGAVMGPLIADKPTNLRLESWEFTPLRRNFLFYIDHINCMKRNKIIGWMFCSFERVVIAVLCFRLYVRGSKLYVDQVVCIARLERE